MDYMRKLYLLFFFSIYVNTIQSQTVTVSGECMTGSIVLSPIQDVNGKMAFGGMGTVGGFAGVQVNVYWMPAPDNLWVLAYDGQPYFQNACNTSSPSSTGNISCPWSAVSGQTCTGASPLDIAVAGVLPVTIMNFTARINNKQVVLNWKTASENNNKGFEIERSQDGVNWNGIGFVGGNINSSVERSYQFSDVNPLSDKAVYRLRQVDQDGKFSYSIIASVHYLKSGFYSIAGNAGNNIYQLNIEATTEKVRLSLFDAGGKKLVFKPAATGVQYIDISKFPSGIYLLQIRKGTETFTEKLIKF